MDDELILTLVHVIRHVKGETGVAAEMLTHHLPVHKGTGVVVPALKMQQDTAVVRLNIQCAGIPDMVVVRFVADAAHLGLIGERYGDGVLLLKALLPAELLAGVGIVKSEIPCTVQVDPIGSDELRARIIRNIILQYNHSPLGYAFIIATKMWTVNCVFSAALPGCFAAFCVLQ